MIEPAIADQFRPYLRAGERVVWTGFPGQGLRFTARDGFLVPFSALWLGFAVFWEMSVFRSHAPPFFLLWGAMFVTIGLVMFAGRFIIDAWIRRRTLYALTTERALVLRRLSGEKLLAAQAAAASLERRANGSGNIRFGARSGRFNDDSWSWWRSNQMNYLFWVPSLSDLVEFVGVPDVMSVYRLARPEASAP